MQNAEPTRRIVAERTDLCITNGPERSEEAGSG